MIWVLIMMLKGYSLALTQFKGLGTVRIYSKAQLVIDACGRDWIVGGQERESAKSNLSRWDKKRD